MGFMLDQLRKKLRKKQAAANAAKAFKRIPKKDITFLPASSTSNQITDFVNNRTVALMTLVGGEDKFVEGDFSVEYIDRTSLNDYVKSEAHTLEANESKANTGSSWNNNSEQDWETKNVEVSTNFKEGIDINAMQFYMIIIEYTELKEVG